MATEPNTHEKEQQQLRQKVEECTNIILFKPNGQRYHDFNSARAEPNQRLVRVFGINNSFTSIDQAWRSKFIRGAISKMKAATNLESGHRGGNWVTIRRSAISSFEEYTEHAGNMLYIAELVQFVTLKVSLSYLFDEAEDAMEMASGSFENVKYIGKRINELWIASKNEEDQILIWSNETRLHKALLEVTTISAALPIPGALPPGSDEEMNPIVDPLIPKANPMNLILPVYETMWRVVLRCVLEVHYRNNEKSSEWNDVLKKYLDALQNGEAMDNGVFWKASDNGVTMIDIVKETLRLYPPSRRIHRVFDGNQMSADIEACHRSALLGQDDPLIFRPERWQTICPELRARVFTGEKGANKLLKTGEESLGFMPFAFVCAADRKETGSFGMKLIALLVAVVSDGLGEKWGLTNERELPDHDTPLRTDRQAYEKLQLKR